MGFQSLLVVCFCGFKKEEHVLEHYFLKPYQAREEEMLHLADLDVSLSESRDFESSIVSGLILDLSDFYGSSFISFRTKSIPFEQLDIPFKLGFKGNEDTGHA